MKKGHGTIIAAILALAVVFLPTQVFAANQENPTFW